MRRPKKETQILAGIGSQKSLTTQAKTKFSRLATAQRLGQQLVEAYTAGDRAAAIQHQQQMLDAIRTQAPAKQAERFAQIDQAIAESDGCYFVMCGDRDRARLGGMQ